MATRIYLGRFKFKISPSIIIRRNSTWSHLPANKQILIPSEGIYPQGFSVTGLSCGVKKKAGVKDLAVILSDRECSGAAVFTTNAFKAAPVIVSEEILASNNGQGLRAIVTNSGCANAVTGTVGLENARKMVFAVDSFLTGVPRSALVMSTGVIGQHIPIEKIESGIAAAKGSMGGGHEDWMRVTEAFMTTDTFPKLRSLQISLPSGTKVSLAGIAKGAGMIHPNMATLLGTIVTDAAITPGPLRQALTYAIDRSFNAISIDGDMSTNDTLCVLANGASGAKLIDDKNSEDFLAFQTGLTEIAEDLAKLVVRDGEGATKFVTVKVEGACLFADAKKVASTIATSSLVKTALFGQDANWGRILCAVGYSGVTSIIPERVSVSFVPTDGSRELPLLVCGEPEQVDEERAAKILAMEDLEIRVDLGIGKEKATMWTCDLSYEYIRINADYRS